MPSHQSRRTLALAGTVLLLAVAIAACGRRDAQADVGAVATPAAVLPTPTAAMQTTSAPEVAAPGAALPGSTEPAAIQSPAPTLKPTANPGPTPDLGAIQRLLDQLDADLGADSSADNDEGNP